MLELRCTEFEYERRNVRRIIFRAVAVLGIGFVSWAKTPEISEKTARELVVNALGALGEDASSVQVQPWIYHWAPEFFTFSAWRPNHKNGLMVVYYFAVNPWTGDVWDAMACKRITSPAIDQEQTAIWKRSRLPDDVRAYLRDRSPSDCALQNRTTPEKKDRDVTRKGVK